MCDRPLLRTGLEALAQQRREIDNLRGRRLGGLLTGRRELVRLTGADLLLDALQQVLAIGVVESLRIPRPLHPRHELHRHLELRLGDLCRLALRGVGVLVWRQHFVGIPECIEHQGAAERRQRADVLPRADHHGADGHGVGLGQYVPEQRVNLAAALAG